MPSILPTKIEQINDYSAVAGRGVLDALEDQTKNNPWTGLADLVHDAILAYDSEAVTNAVDQYNKGIKARLNPTAALQGIDSRIAGSKAFRDQAQAIDIEKRHRDQLDNILRQQRLQEEANALNADYQAFVNRLGSDAASIWYKRNENRLKASPYAYDKVMGTTSANKWSLWNNPNEATSATLPENILENTAAQLLREKDSASAIGNFKDLYDNEGRLKTKDTFINSYIKRAGYEKEDARDFAQNINTDAAILSAYAERLGLPAEAVIAALNQFTGPTALSYIPGLGRFRQDSVDIDAAKDWMDRVQATFANNRNQYLRADRQLKAIQQAIDNNLPETLKRNRNLKIARANDAFDQGIYTSEEKNSAIAAANREYNANIANILNNVLKSAEILKKSTQPK